jgi:hypothetical protein
MDGGFIEADAWATGSYGVTRDRSDRIRGGTRPDYPLDAIKAPLAKVGGRLSVCFFFLAYGGLGERRLWGASKGGLVHEDRIWLFFCPA